MFWALCSLFCTESLPHLFLWTQKGGWNRTRGQARESWLRRSHRSLSPGSSQARAASRPQPLPDILRRGRGGTHLWGRGEAPFPAGSPHRRTRREVAGKAAATRLREPRCVSGRQGLGWVPGVVTGRGRKTTRRRSPSYHTRAGRRGHPGRRGATRASPRGHLDPAGPGRPVWGPGTRGGSAPSGPSRRCGSVSHSPRRPERSPSVFPYVVTGNRGGVRDAATFPCAQDPRAQL